MAKSTSPKSPSERPTRRRSRPRAVVGTGGILMHDAPGRPAPADRPSVPVDDLPYPDAADLAEAFGTLSDRVGGVLESFSPSLVRELNHEIRERLRRSPIRVNSYGYDPWGFNPDVARRTLLLFALIYRYYFRVRTTGLENLPKGRMLVIPNHAGQIALDAGMIGVATVLEADPPRPLRGMGEYWLPTLPFFNVFMARVGGVVGTPKNARDILEHGEAVIAFPEGVRGMNKTFAERYQLQEFGYGFMRLALETQTPIVPVAVVGSEEQAISIANVKPLADLLGMPAFPILLNYFPLPVRYHIHFGEPMEFRGNANDEDEVIGKKVEQVKDRIHDMIQAGLRRRSSWFW